MANGSRDRHFGGFCRAERCSCGRIGDHDFGSVRIDYGAVSISYRYPSTADDDLTPLPPSKLTGQPGSRAPRVPITLSGREMSTLDLYGSRLVLLDGPAGESSVAAAGKLDVPTDAYVFGADVAAACGIADDGASLVRPDGFVAWRSNSGAADPVHMLTGVIRSMLFR